MSSWMQMLILLALAFSVVAAARIDEDEYNENAPDDESPLRRSYTYDPNVYNPTHRDYTNRCMRMAKYSGEHSCTVFNECCSEDSVLNKLNGDKCQLADPTNGCNLDSTGSRIQWSQCRAFNCTEEITTTTSTTARPRSAAPMISLSTFALLIPALLVAQRR